MAMSAHDIKQWIEDTIEGDDTTLIAIGDGGLTLENCRNDGYLEVGGKPEPEYGFISLDTGEDEGFAQCGLKLQRHGEDGENPAVFLCDMHSEAPKLRAMLTKLVNSLGSFRHSHCEQEQSDLRSARELLKLLDEADEIRKAKP